MILHPQLPKKYFIFNHIIFTFVRLKLQSSQRALNRSLLKPPSKICIISHSKNLNVNWTKTDEANKLNIPTYEGENPRANMGSNIIINDLVTLQANVASKGESIEAKVDWNEPSIVSGDGVKVYNQNKVLCDTVKRLYPHVF